MILYNVTVNIDEEIHQEWVTWMKEIHIPEVLNTGFFVESKLCRVLAEEVGGVVYSVQYLAKNKEDYALYQQKFATELQEKHRTKFREKFVAFRTLLEVIYQNKKEN